MSLAGLSNHSNPINSLPQLKKCFDKLPNTSLLHIAVIGLFSVKTKITQQNQK